MLERGKGFYRFDSLEQFLAVADVHRERFQDKGGIWNGGRSYSEERAMCFTGDPAKVAKAESLMEQIETSGLVKRGTDGFVRDVAGILPLVPAYLAGDPEHMLRPNETDAASDRSPLNVYVDVAVTWDWSADQLVERGTAILALVLLLNQQRAVTLHWYASLSGDNNNRGAIPIVPITTQPLDISTASHVLTSAGFFRKVLFSWDDYHGGGGGRPIAFGSPTRPMHQDAIRKGLEASPDDLILFGGSCGDQFMSKPMEFIRHYLGQYAPDMLA